MPSNAQQSAYKLSSGFFQLFAENRIDGVKPILQIINSRLTNDQTAVRLRLNDGIFTYATIVLRGKGLEKFNSLGLEKSQSIIKLLDFSLNKTFKDKIRRTYLIINDFELLLKESSIIGCPVPHSGNPEDHLGLRIDLLDQSPSKNYNTRFPSNNVNITTRNIKEESSSGNDTLTVPIISISPYLMRWKICGVVTEKTAVREVNLPSGPSKVFDFSITDKEGTEIKITCFGEMVNKLDDLIQISSSYYIKGTNKAVKTAKKPYNTTGHEYEIMMRNDVEIEKCEDSVELPAQKIKRVHLSQINCYSGESIDVIGIVDNMEEASSVSTKNGILKRKTIALIDDSGVVVRVTAWNEFCDEFTDDLLHKPIILKNVVVKEFNGIYSLGFNYRSKIISSDDVEVCRNLLDWYERERSSIQVSNPLPPSNPYGKNITISAAVANDNVDKTGNTRDQYYTIIARISRFKENLVYKSCAQKDCKKKVTVIDGGFYCSKCDITSDVFKYSLMVVLEIFDHSGSRWLTMFDNQAEKLLKKSAFEVGEIIETYGDFDGHNKVVSNVINTLHCFNIRRRIEMYNDLPFVKWLAVEVKPVNLTMYVEHLKEMFKDFEEFCTKHGL